MYNITYGRFDNNTHDKLLNKNKLMVVVPHPDDELNIASVLIKRFLDKSDEVYIVFSTNFDAYGKKEALNRYREIKRLYRYLNIPDENLIFLGYKSIRYFDKTTESNYSLENDRRRYIFPDWSDRYYLSDRLDIKLSDLLYDLFLHIKPDVIVGIDYDLNLDHRYLSIEFDQASKKISEIAEYKPLVLKGFSYATSWMGKKDFYRGDLPSSQFNKNGSSVLAPYFWADRIQIPYGFASDLGYCMRSCWAYKVYSFYRSQNALSHTNQLINADQVYWKLHTDNIFDGKVYEVSSGSVEGNLSNVAYIRDDISKDEYKFTLGWKPDEHDTHPYITFYNKSGRGFKNIEILCRFGSAKYNCDSKFLINNKSPQKTKIVEEDDLTKYKLNFSELIDAEKICLSFDNIGGIRILDIYIPDGGNRFNLEKMVRADTRDFIYSLVVNKGDKIKLQLVDETGEILDIRNYSFMIYSDSGVNEIKNLDSCISLTCDFNKGEIRCIHNTSGEVIDSVFINTSFIYRIYIGLERFVEKLVDWYLIRFNSYKYKHKRVRNNK